MLPCFLFFPFILVHHTQNEPSKDRTPIRYRIPKTGLHLKSKVESKISTDLLQKTEQGSRK
ncbi:hypothetical protein OBV_01580 [Oscillibacter valericigenes Sjm18-20]|nr:hypothetical protein OBV_01580 [Oscillibacter valericigenes Sjm18-20]